MNYILKDKKPVKTENIDDWARFMTKANRTVKKTRISDKFTFDDGHTDRFFETLTGGVTEGCDVSTVFLGIDHQYGSGKPILFETMVFGGLLDGEQVRYCTWEEAEAGHEEMVKRVKEA